MRALTAEDSEEGSRLVTDVFADTPCRRLFCIVSLVSTNFVTAERVGSVCDVFSVADSEEASRLGSRLRSEVCVTVDSYIVYADLHSYYFIGAHRFYH